MAVSLCYPASCHPIKDTKKKSLSIIPTYREVTWIHLEFALGDLAHLCETRSLGYRGLKSNFPEMIHMVSTFGLYRFLHRPAWIFCYERT